MLYDGSLNLAPLEDVIFWKYWRFEFRTIFRKFSQFPQAMRLALQLNDKALVEEIFLSCQDGIVQRQLAYMLGKHQVIKTLKYVEN